MSSRARILELQISFIWTETYDTLLAASPRQAPMGYLGKEKDFALEYDKIREREEKQNGGGQPQVLTRPWRSRAKYIHHFWQYYFENREPNGLDGAEAWKYLVPFRLRIPRIESPWQLNYPKFKFVAQGLFYPHGVAVVIRPRLLFTTATAAGDSAAGGSEQGISAPEMMRYALQLAKELELTVTLPDGAQQIGRLDKLGQELLNYFRRRALGPKAEQGKRPSDPLTVATVIQGRGGDASRPIVPYTDLHHVLEGMCCWDSNWRTRPLEPLEIANLLQPSSPKGHIVYHLKRGRAVWMPNYFASPPSSHNRTLSCYHWNVTLALLHTEMLAQVIVMFADCLHPNGPRAGESLQGLAKYAAIRLGLLYGSKKEGSKKYTYNSPTPRSYIDEIGYVDSINKVRKYFELPPLAYKPW